LIYPYLGEVLFRGGDIMLDEIYKEEEKNMEATINALHREFGSIRTGVASLSLLDPIRVDYYGNLTPLNQVASLSIPESRLITIQPWDKSLMGPIEKAIQSSDLGINPSNDGKVIRLSVPPLTEERRKQLVKVVRRYAEEARISIRNSRRTAIETVKKAEKEKNLSEDESRKGQTHIQKITDEYIEKIGQITEKKEQEVMEV
jgi:ribosome recycling factor